MRFYAFMQILSYSGTQKNLDTADTTWSESQSTGESS